VERAGNDAVELALEVGANVDQKSAPLDGRECVGGLEPLDPRFRRLEELVQRSPLDADSHGRIIFWPLRLVQPFTRVSSGAGFVRLEGRAARAEFLRLAACVFELRACVRVDE
jgi:hypothetical protein